MTTESTNLYVEDFPSAWESSDLVDNFKGFGAIESTMILHKRNGESKCKGFVNFETIEGANKAIDFFKKLSDIKDRTISHDGESSVAFTESGERTRGDTIESIFSSASVDMSLEDQFKSLKVSLAVRKEKMQSPTHGYNHARRIMERMENRSRASTLPDSNSVSQRRSYRSRTDSQQSASSFAHDRNRCICQRSHRSSEHYFPDDHARMRADTETSQGNHILPTIVQPVFYYPVQQYPVQSMAPVTMHVPRQRAVSAPMDFAYITPYPQQTYINTQVQPTNSQQYVSAQTPAGQYKQENQTDSTATRNVPQQQQGYFPSEWYQHPQVQSWIQWFGYRC